MVFTMKSDLCYNENFKRYATQRTVPQLSIMVIHNSTWSILIQWIMIILSDDNLT